MGIEVVCIALKIASSFNQYGIDIMEILPDCGMSEVTYSAINS